MTGIVKIFNVNVEILVLSTLQFHQCIILGVVDYYLTPKHQFLNILSTSALKARFGAVLGSIFTGKLGGLSQVNNSLVNASKLAEPIMKFNLGSRPI